MPMQDAQRNAMSRLGSMGQDTYASENLDEGKAPMSSVNYGPAQDPSQSCGACVHFMEGQCDLVAGQIDPAGVCDLFQPAGQQAPMAPEAALMQGMAPQ